MPQPASAAIADKIVVTNAGRIEQMGAPLDLYDRPANIFVAGFLGSPAMNFIAGRAGADGQSVQLPDGSRLEVRSFAPVLAGADVIFGIRPEHIKLAADGGVDAEVLIVEPSGSETYLTVRLGGQDLVCVMNDRIGLVHRQGRPSRSRSPATGRISSTLPADNGSGHSLSRAICGSAAKPAVAWR